MFDLMDTRDPTNTGLFLTRIPLLGDPQDIAIGAGLAFVTSGTGGLQIVNYRAFDTQGVAPTIDIVKEPRDADPATPGIQIEEGQTARLTATTGDDVQVRNVEVLVNGKVVSNDVSYPFDLSAVLPTLAANGSDSVEISVRSTDTGGNVTLSAPISVQLIANTTAAVLIEQNVANGAAVYLTYDTLALGAHRFEIDAARVIDRAGNALGAATLVTNFEVREFTVEWIGASGGRWNDAANWSTGHTPGIDDDVEIACRAVPSRSMAAPCR